MKETPDPLAGLSPEEKRKALAEILRKKEARRRADLPEIAGDPDARYEPFPLTDLQQAYWVGRDPSMVLGNTSCHGYFEWRWPGLDLVRLGNAWRRVISRHDMLRAVVLPTGEQKILKDVPPYEIRVLELRGRSSEEAARALEEVRREMSHQVLRSDRWPMFDMRATLQDGGSTTLHLSFDLIIADIWSMYIIFGEMLQWYADPGSSMEDLGISFRDYVLAERAFEGTETYERSRKYWLDRLATLPPAPDLPLARDPATVRRPHFVRRQVRLSPETAAEFRALARKKGLTASTALLAAYADVLATWSRSPQLTLNLTLFNRSPVHPDVDRLVGDFSTTTLLEIDASGERTFAARARRIQERMWRDLDHRFYSGVRVVRDLGATRRGQIGTLMPVVFTSAVSLSEAKPRFPYATPPGVEGGCVISQTPQTWIDHQVAEENGALVLGWDAVGELFPERLLDDMFEAYSAHVRGLASHEDAWEETRLRLVPDDQIEERRRANATRAPLPDGLLHTPFQAQARRDHARQAVIAPDRTLTYQELEQRSAHLARRLRASGARPDHLVGVVMEKGWEEIVAVLAIEMAGAAYLPVDPELPEARRFHLLRHGEVGIVLTQPWLDGSLAWPDGVERLVVDTARPEEVASSPDPVQRPDDLAYVIFTSGSTGLPKGVMIEHLAALNTIADVNRRFRVGPDDAVLALSSLSFDLSVYDVFGLLAAGGRVVLPASRDARDPAAWLELLKRERVTIWNSVPALLSMLVDYAAYRPDARLEHLRLVLLSGDWIPLDLPGRIRALAPHAEVVSLGGATEASIWSIGHPIDQVDPGCPSIPYGRPLANQTFHVLDDSLEDRPTWVPGELYIGGTGLARGYWRDEERTRESFIVHPRTGERLYRTGDLGRYRPGGEIELLGRKDFQVKIRGHRIELGEIETHLSRHPSVKHAVAGVTGDSDATKRLVAYVVPEDGAEIDRRALQRCLEERIPEYMVPAAFVALEALPLTATGKVDRKALSLPAEVAVQPSREPRAAGGETERRILELVNQMLEGQRVGPDDDLGTTGANSLLFVQMLARVNQEFGVDLPLARLLALPTVAELARLIDELKAAPPAADGHNLPGEPGENVRSSSRDP